MKSVFTYTVILFALLNLAGCASSSGVVKKASPVLIRKPVSLDSILVESSSSLAGLETEARGLKDSISSGLNETGLFGRVRENQADIKPGDGIRIKAEIKSIKKVSDQKREWVGAWAGRARILVQVTVFDLSSGKPIESFEAEGQSGRSAFAGTTDEAIQRAAEQVVALVVKLNAQTSQ